MRIIIVEDEKDLADAIARGLIRQAYSVDVAYDGIEALRMAEINDYDVVILDLNLPGVDGLEVCKRIRAVDSSTGILMLTARASVESCIQGLDLGADDYLVKPFHFSELLARVRAVLRRGGEVRKVNLSVGNLVLDPNSLGASIGGQPVLLTAREFALLEYLVRNAGRVVSQEEILEHVWNEDVNLFTHTVKVHINNLRKKLKSSGLEGLIRTIKGEGYIVGG